MLEVRIQAQAISEKDGGHPDGDAFRAQVEIRSRFVPFRTGGVRVILTGRIVLVMTLALTVFGGGITLRAGGDQPPVEVSTVAGAMFETVVTETGFDATAPLAHTSGSSSCQHPEVA